MNPDRGVVAGEPRKEERCLNDVRVRPTSMATSTVALLGANIAGFISMNERMITRPGPLLTRLTFHVKCDRSSTKRNETRASAGHLKTKVSPTDIIN